MGLDYIIWMICWLGAFLLVWLVFMLVFPWAANLINTYDKWVNSLFR